MQSWGWGTGNVPPVASGKCLDDIKVSPVSTSVLTEESDDSSRLSLKDRRLALEQDVAKLRKKHTQEVNLHRALERALQRPAGNLPRIPPYLPAKVQKLLADVALLEEEVIRLEDHVVFLRQEITDETAQQLSNGAQQLSNGAQQLSNGAQKQKPNADSNNLIKLRNVSTTQVSKEFAQAHEVAKDPPASKFHAGLQRATTKPAKVSPKDSPRNSTKGSPKSSTKGSAMGFTKDSSKGFAKASSKGLFNDTLKEQLASKSSKSSLLTSSAKEPVSSASSASRKAGGMVIPAPITPLSRKLPNPSDVLSKFQGLQQPWKSTGGTNSKNNLFRQFNSVNWGDSKYEVLGGKQPDEISIPKNNPRASFDASFGLFVNWSDKLGLGSSTPKTSSVSSPGSSFRIGKPLSGTSSVRMWEKENLQSASSKLISRGSTASRLGLSMDLSSSNVERKSIFGSEGASAKVSSLSMIKEGVKNDRDPNQLSEDLVRCLISMYSKMAKSSLQNGKVSQGTRSGSLGASSRSKASNDLLRDLYGICKDSPLQDVSSYRRTQEITADTIDANAARSCTLLYKKLNTLLEQLEKADLEVLSHHEKLAFWINVYNVCMMHAFLEHGIPSTPSKVVALMRKAVVDVGGYKLNALTIEHFILRLPCRPKNVRKSPWKHFQRTETNPAMAFLKNMGMEEIIEHSAYGLDRNEAMVTFALCCGSRSSPALRVYTARGIESELEMAKSEYLQAAIGVSNKKKIYLPKLLEWYMRDFAKDMEGLLEWLCQQLTGPLQDAVQECVKYPNEGVLSHSIEVMPYDFNFRYLFLA